MVAIICSFRFEPGDLTTVSELVSTSDVSVLILGHRHLDSLVHLRSQH
jgi:hypothetical protein